MAQKEKSDLALSIAGPGSNDSTTYTPVSLKVPHITEQRTLSYRIPVNITCCERVKLILSPIQSHDEIVDENLIKTVVTVTPEAFRMLFYLWFWIFVFIAIFITVMWADVDFDDNIMKDTYGSTNICIVFDFPPITYFAPTLWIPNIFLIVFYLVLDLFRARDAVKNDQITSTFYRFYCMLAVYEIFAFCFFPQIFATSPVENMFIHSFPFVLVTFAQWTIAFKRLMWFIKMGWNSNYSRHQRYTGYIYIVLMLIVIVGKALLNVPNMLGAQLYKKSGWEWTGPYSLINDRLFVFLTMICPPILYYVAARDIECVKFTMDREPTLRAKTLRKARESAGAQKEEQHVVSPTNAKFILCSGTAPSANSRNTTTN